MQVGAKPGTNRQSILTEKLVSLPWVSRSALSRWRRVILLFSSWLVWLLILGSWEKKENQLSGEGSAGRPTKLSGGWSICPGEEADLTAGPRTYREVTKQTKWGFLYCEKTTPKHRQTFPPMRTVRYCNSPPRKVVQSVLGVFKDFNWLKPCTSCPDLAAIPAVHRKLDKDLLMFLACSFSNKLPLLNLQETYIHTRYENWMDLKMKCWKETINVHYYREKLMFNTTQKHSFSTFRSSVSAFNLEKNTPNNLTNLIIPVHKATL